MGTPNAAPFPLDEEIRRLRARIVELEGEISHIRGPREGPDHQNAAALREGELQQVFDNISVCMYLIDVTADGRFKFGGFNSAEERAVGLTSAEVSGKFIEEVFAGELAEKLVANYRRCLETGVTLTYDDELNLPIGRRNFHSNLIPMRNTSGRIHRIVGACIDTTDFKRAQQESLARQKLESIGVLAGGIAHDFNNLLGSILAEAELAATELAAGESAIEGIQKIGAVASQGAEIVRELMIYSGQDKADPVEPVDLSRLVEEMLQLLKVTISKHAVLMTDLQRSLPAVLVRASQIRQILMNLVINASEAIGEKGGIIKIATSAIVLPQNSDPHRVPHLPLGDCLKLEVSDTGGGMTEKVQAKVFDPFFSTKFAGRGLGLAVVQGIVRDHGGAINLVSTPGHGTTFEILLPCASGTAPSSRATIVRPQGSAHRPLSATVLVVEDEAVLRLAVSKMLRKKGFRVVEAIDGSSALELVRTHNDEIDVMLLDVTLPGVSSREVLEEAQHMRPKLEVILTSAYSRETIDNSFSGLRIARFIRKPFQFDELMRLLQDALCA
jgi:two-component system, cell cycle sensor histidine kinase and response regulator CckA